MIILCTGGRDYKDREFVFRVLEQLSPKGVMVGDCPTGVDLFVREWCEVRKTSSPGFGYTVFDADWDTNGLAAGPLRNQDMVTLGFKIRAVVLAFKGGKGTRDCVDRARMRKMIVLEAK